MNILQKLLGRTTEHRAGYADSIINASMAAARGAQYSVSNSEPWRGIGPLGWASSSGALAANLESRLKEELSAPTGLLIPMPEGEGSASELTKDISNLKGYPSVVETAYGTGDPATRPSADWRQRRIGADPPATLCTIRDSVSESIMAACGVPASILKANSDGTAQRESLRRWVTTGLIPCSEIASQFISEALEVEIKMSFESLYSSDLSGRSRAVASLVKSGMTLSKAAELAGLMEAE